MSEPKITPEEAPDLTQMDAILSEYRGQKGSVIPVLQKAQKIYGYLPPQVLRQISAGLRDPLSKIYGVATFYSQFYLTRRGRHVVRVCDGTACHVRGAAKIIDELGHELHIIPGQTTDDYRVTYEVVYCLGSCGLAPVAVVDDHVEGRLTPQQLVETVRSLA